MVLTNTSSAIISDWTMDLYMPGFMWLNNAWCGKLEFHQNTESGEKVQIVDLREYQSYEIELDHYIDHTGPMIPLNKGDKFVYYPSKADNEYPLVQKSETEEVNSTAIVGFIVYVPDKGLKGEEIPLIARIICVADALDAMNSNRCYRPRLTKEVIIEELIKNKGKQFDPDVIDHLMKLINRGDIKIGE